MTITRHTIDASMLVEPYYANVSESPVWADGVQGSLSWTPDGVTTLTRLYNDLTGRFEMQMLSTDVGSPKTAQASRTATGLTVGKTYRVVGHAYGAAAAQVFTWIDAAAGHGASTTLTASVQEITADFTATATSHTLYLRTNTYSGSTRAVWTDVAVYEITSTPYLHLKPERAVVQMDEAWFPYVRARLTCPIPPNDVLGKIDPRKTTRVAVTMSQADHDSLKASDLTDMLGLTGPSRTNYLWTPRPGVIAGLGASQFYYSLGTGETGTSYLTGDDTAQGPNGLPGMARHIVDTPASSGPRGWVYLGVSGTAYAIPSGSYIQGSMYVRSSVATTMTFQVAPYNYSGVFTASAPPVTSAPVTVPANTWVRLTADVGPTTINTSTVQMSAYSTVPLPAGTVTDVTQAMVEKVAALGLPVGDYFDGSDGRTGTPRGFARWPGVYWATSTVKTFGATTAADLTTILASRTAAYLTDLFGDQYGQGIDPALNLSRTLNLMIWDRTLDYVNGTMTLTLTSDEMLLQDYARPSLSNIFDPPVTTSLKALVNWALNIARLGALDASSSDFVITSTDAIWNQGESLWSFLDAFVSNAGLRLWSDENRTWFLKPPYDGTAGTVAINGLTALDDVLSRENWGDMVLLENEWTDPTTGTTETKYAFATAFFTKTVVVKHVAKAAPTTAGANALLARVVARGREVATQGVSNYAVSPGLTANISTPTTTVPPVLVASVSWNFPEDEMTVTTRDLP